MYLGIIVEVSLADDLYDNPLHPYTISLLSAIPIPDPVVEKERETILLAGDLPAPRTRRRHAGSTRAVPMSSRRAARKTCPNCGRSRATRRLPLGRADPGGEISRSSARRSSTSRQRTRSSRRPPSELRRDRGGIPWMS